MRNSLNGEIFFTLDNKKSNGQEVHFSRFGAKFVFLAGAGGKVQNIVVMGNGSYGPVWETAIKFAQGYFKNYYEKKSAKQARML